MTIRVRSDFSLIFIFLIDNFHSWKGNFFVCIVQGLGLPSLQTKTLCIVQGHIFSRKLGFLPYGRSCLFTWALYRYDI